MDTSKTNIVSRMELLFVSEIGPDTLTLIPKSSQSQWVSTFSTPKYQLMSLFPMEKRALTERGQRDDTLQLQHVTWWSHDDHDADGLNRLNRLNPLWFGHKAVQSLHQEAASFWFQSYTKKSWKFLTPGNQLTSACTCCGASPCFSSSVHLTCQIYQATLHGHFASLRFPKLISNC